MAEIQAFAAKHSDPFRRPGTITDYEVRAFDLSSAITVVLTAKLPGSPAKGQHDTSFIYYVALFRPCRHQRPGQSPLFPSPTAPASTPSSHGTDRRRGCRRQRRGDLLFRQSDVGISYGSIASRPTRSRKSRRRSSPEGLQSLPSMRSSIFTLALVNRIECGRPSPAPTPLPATFQPTRPPRHRRERSRRTEGKADSRR